MPKIRRKRVPGALLEHLWDRVELRQISLVQLSLLADWFATDSDVPTGRWFKRFPEMTVCGEGDLGKTFLRLGQVPEGEEVI